MRNESAKTRTVGYVRVSTTQQSDEGVSLQAQAKKIRAYCDLHDLELIEIVEDAGFSGKSIAGRPGMSRVLEMVKSRKVGNVVILKLDRLARNLKEACEISETLQKKDVSLHSISEKIDSGPATGRLFYNILSAMAAWEREMIGERTKMALQFKKENGERVSLHAPYGFSFDGDKVVKNDKEQAVIEKVHELHKAGHSIRAIVGALEVAGYRNRNGKPIGRNETWKILEKRSVNLRSLDPEINRVLTDPTFNDLLDEMEEFDRGETDEIMSNRQSWQIWKGEGNMGNTKRTKGEAVSKEKIVKAIVQFIQESEAAGEPIPDTWLTGKRTRSPKGTWERVKKISGYDGDKDSLSAYWKKHQADLTSKISEALSVKDAKPEPPPQDRPVKTAKVDTITAPEKGSDAQAAPPEGEKEDTNDDKSDIIAKSLEAVILAKFDKVITDKVEALETLINKRLDAIPTQPVKDDMGVTVDKGAFPGKPGKATPKGKALAGKVEHIHGNVDAELSRLLKEDMKTLGNMSRTLTVILWRYYGKPKLSFELEAEAREGEES